MQHVKTFKTKTGYCHILPDKIVLTPDENVGDISRMRDENNIGKVLMLYAIASIGVFYSVYITYNNGHTVQSVLFGLLGVYLVYGIFASMNYSSTPILDRGKIKTIQFKKAIYGLTRSRFEVLFEDHQGKVKKRLIMLPGSLTGGQAETEKAIQMMREENLLDMP